MQISDLAPAIAIIAANVTAVILQWIQLKNLRAELEGTQLVVKDSAELRTVLQRPLEGIWSLKGEFTKFQGKNSMHFSSGQLTLLWDASKEHYAATYSYSVFPAGESHPLVTAICKGHSYGDVSGRRTKSVTVTFTIESRTSKGTPSSYRQHFDLELKLDKQGITSPKLASTYSVNGTVGQLLFSK